MATADDLKKILTEKFSPVHLEIIDDSQWHAGHAEAKKGGSGHFTVTIVSRTFAGKPLTARHKLVYAALKDIMGSAVHALALTTLTPEEYRK